MKNFTLLLPAFAFLPAMLRKKGAKAGLAFAFFWLLISASQAQGFLQLGTYLVDDEGHRMIGTSDGGYITAGSAGNNAVLYKSDCLGNLVAKIESTVGGDQAVFYDVVELADGNILAVGRARFSGPSDTIFNVILLRTTPMLLALDSSSFPILNKDSFGESITQASSGHILVWGEVIGTGSDFTDAFFQRVDPATLQPSADPVIFNNGVDIASRILHTNDGNYLLCGSSFSGDFSNPDALIENLLLAYKVDENGAIAWQAIVRDSFLLKYSIGTSCNAVQSSVSGNFLLGGNMYGGADELKQDLFFALIGNDGTVLDTVYSFAPGQQFGATLAENHAYPGYYILWGVGMNEQTEEPYYTYSVVGEIGNQLVTGAAYYDVANLANFRDQVEIDPGRFAYFFTYPDNYPDLSTSDIYVSTPEVAVGVVYQNCALAVTLGTPGVAFQWYLEGQPIPNANQGVFFPTEPGLYQVGVIDDKGCYGASDTFRVNEPMADFTFTASNLTVTFSNASANAGFYFWDFGDGQTSTQPNPSHTYSANGIYSVYLIAETSCGFADTTVQQVGVVSSSEPSWLEHFSLSPNPTSGTFSVEMSGEPQEKVEFALFNAVGQLASREALGFQSGFLQKTFDLGQLPAGVYSLQIRSGNEAKNVRVVKR